MTKAHTPQAKAVLDALNDELEHYGKVQHRDLQWSAAEEITLELIAGTIDRRVEVAKLYDRETDPKNICMLSCELRQLDGTVVRMLKQVNAEPPAPMNQTQRKNQHAANVRWDREKARNGA